MPTLTTRQQNDWNHEVSADGAVIGWVTRSAFGHRGWQFTAASNALAALYPDSERDYPTALDALPVRGED